MIVKSKKLIFIALLFTVSISTNFVFAGSITGEIKSLKISVNPNYEPFKNGYIEVRILNSASNMVDVLPITTNAICYKEMVALLMASYTNGNPVTVSFTDGCGFVDYWHPGAVEVSK